ncbi:response regulator [Nitrospirillum iridis]|uniref:CheY-like chemotaxis protein n=1 Tax=Nitrospirillum iridis TaxID=765888 RepID=A0A7X0EDL8_9PROT|nr:response regulator [Nitrospirillum iridis]MBB6250514.1 CheY-like chemotaxis protein [Nitrospirillum iridis]
MASGKSGKYYRLDGLSVLVADDNRFVRTILITVLRGLGIGRVLQAESGEEAMAILDVSTQIQGASDIDIVFADHLMAPVDGLGLLKWVRHHDHEKLKFIPYVMMSGEADENAVRLARDGGVTEYLAKPMSVANVASRLLAIVDKPRPFIRAPGYIGPDRRRQTLPYGGDDRRVITGHRVLLEEASAEALPPVGQAVPEVASGSDGDAGAESIPVAPETVE